MKAAAARRRPLLLALCARPSCTPCLISWTTLTSIASGAPVLAPFHDETKCIALLDTKTIAPLLGLLPCDGVLLVQREADLVAVFALAWDEQRDYSFVGSGILWRLDGAAKKHHLVPTDIPEDCQLLPVRTPAGPSSSCGGAAPALSLSTSCATAATVVRYFCVAPGMSEASGMERKAINKQLLTASASSTSVEKNKL